MRASALRITHLINVMIGEGLTTHVHMLTYSPPPSPFSKNTHQK